MTICGVWGSISLFNLAWHTLSKGNDWPGHPMQWFGITIGLITCMGGLFYSSENNIMLAVFGGPIIATAHLLYLSKFGE